MGPNFKAIIDAQESMGFCEELVLFVNEQVLAEVEVIEKEFSSVISIPCYKCKHVKVLDGYPMALAKGVRDARLGILDYILFRDETGSNCRRLCFDYEETKIGLKNLEFELFKLRQEQEKVSVTCLLYLVKSELPTTCSSWEWAGIVGLNEG